MKPNYLYKLPMKYTVNKTVITPKEAYNNKSLTIPHEKVKYFASGLLSNYSNHTIAIDWYSDNWIRYLSKHYKLSYSEVSRILLLDNCYNTRINNNNFRNIYNTWNKIAKKELDKNEKGVY